MRIAIILNGISRKKKYVKDKILPLLQTKFSVELFETQSSTDACRLAAGAVDKKFDFILAAGGDGTVHQVLNGMLTAGAEHANYPVLGLIPIGTGNDFARAMNIPHKVQQLINSISTNKFRKIDIGKVQFRDAEDQSQTQTRYFINVADVGMGPEVVKRISGQRNFFGTSYSYYQAIIKIFFHYNLIHITAIADDWSWAGKARAIAVANGKYFGQGLCIAPEAKPDDNIFSIFICASVSVSDFIRYSIPLKMGKKVIHPEVQYRNCSHLDLTAKEACGIEADGEYLGVLPARIELIKNAIRFLEV